MRRIVRWGTLLGPLAITVAAVAVPMPLRMSMAGMVLGLLLFQLALVGSFDQFIPSTRRYLALREEVDHLLVLVRDLNAEAVEARRRGLEEPPTLDPILSQMHQCVDRLPYVAGVPVRLHATPGPVGEAEQPRTH